MHNALDKGQVGGKVLRKEVEELWSNQIKSSECTAIRTPVKHHRLLLVRINRDKLVPQSFRDLEFFTRSYPHSIFKRWDTPGFTRDYQVDGYCDGWMDDELLLPFLYLSPHFSPSIYQSLSHHHRHHRGPWNRVDASSFPGVDLWRDIKISTADHRARISQGTDIRVCPKSWIIQRLSHL